MKKVCFTLSSGSHMQFFFRQFFTLWIKFKLLFKYRKMKVVRNIPNIHKHTHTEWVGC